MKQNVLHLLFSLFAIAVLAGCSDSTPATGNYPLTLSIVTDTIVSNTAVFNFRVAKTSGGAAVLGSKLYRTNYSSVYGTIHVYYDGVMSDSSGTFPHVTAVLGDTVTSIAYQAVSLSSGDTLTSNYIRWP